MSLSNPSTQRQPLLLCSKVFIGSPLLISATRPPCPTSRTYTSRAVWLAIRRWRFWCVLIFTWHLKASATTRVDAWMSLDTPGWKTSSGPACLSPRSSPSIASGRRSIPRASVLCYLPQDQLTLTDRSVGSALRLGTDTHPLAHPGCDVERHTADTFSVRDTQTRRALLWMSAMLTKSGGL